MNKTAFSLFTGKYSRIVALLVLALSLVLLCSTTRYHFTSPVEGIYLLKGDKGHLFELKSDILLGEYQRLIGRIEFEAFHDRWRSKNDVGTAKPYIKYQWHEKAGRGYFITFFPDGTKFLACFGQLTSDDKKPVKGLFVGGGLPHSHYEIAELKMNETGIAFYNGKEWHHLWSNASEAISPESEHGARISPSSWGFLGSRVIFASQYKLLIKSSHLIRLNTVPIRIDRYLIYHAGDRFFTLVNHVANIGDTQTSFRYTYGNKPSVGNLGVAAGNAGWTRDRIYNVESHIDLLKNSYAGICDQSNPVTRDTPDSFTGLASFIEWQGGALPDSAYFSNRFGVEPSDGALIPPTGNSNRVLTLQWASRQLIPGQTEKMVLTIGMANNDPKSRLPRLPDIRPYKPEFEFLLTQ